MPSRWTANVSAISANAVDMGPRVAHWLREQAYPGSAKAKRVARDFGVSEGTARLWLGGKRPESRWLEQMAKRWGWRFVTFVHAPLCAPEADVVARLDRLQSQYDQFGVELEALRQAGAGQHETDLAPAVPGVA